MASPRLELDPGESAAAGLVGGIGGFDHDALVGASAGSGVGAVDVFQRFSTSRAGESMRRGKGRLEVAGCRLQVRKGGTGRARAAASSRGETVSGLKRRSAMVFEAAAALAEGQVEGEFAVGIKEIEGHEEDRDRDAHLVGDALAANALAEDGEMRAREGWWRRTLRSPTHRDEAAMDGAPGCWWGWPKSQPRISPSRMSGPSVVGSTWAKASASSGKLSVTSSRLRE